MESCFCWWSVADINETKCALKSPLPDFQDDDIFEVFSEVKEKLDVQCERTGLRTLINKNLLVPVKSYKRKVFQVIKEDPQDELHSPIGSFILAINPYENVFY